MNDGYYNPVASLGINTQLSGSSVSSGSSPLNSPLISPVNHFDNNYSNWDPSQLNQTSLQPPPSPNGSVSSNNSSTPSKPGNTFVHKLHNMVIDEQYQHLIAWTYTGLSFIVCNITDFSRDVLPKHFKHNNFSSFVRQLNMYGFHKVNKSPRGHRTLAENQIWEFSHPKFLKNRPELLDEIKRKALEAESVRKDNTDVNSHMAMMQLSQTDMIQQIVRLKENLSQVMKELSEARQQQNAQQLLMKDMIDFMTKQYGELPFQVNGMVKHEPERPPSIFVTSPENPLMQQQDLNFYLNVNDSSPKTPTSPSLSPTISNHFQSNNQTFTVPTQQQQLPPQQLNFSTDFVNANNNFDATFNNHSPLLNQNNNYRSPPFQ